MSHTHANKDQLLARTRRIAGQIAAIERAIADEAGCAALLHQVAGVRGAVAGLMDELVADHLQSHVAAPGLSDAERAQGGEDLLAAIRRYTK
ncbi:MAG TPA: metal/formaldehyde-sensitive transcriptional repressor [Sphingopyxis sp.]|uniref:metal/formaldehyde-sensitive transcriptional repressor n=1 Tax=Sphingopyxis sp. TaxID=1908224 RepID=UPI002E32E6D4|nr:metal/formaldehyde-sensitive transcriptional repressor [Sphingopyxis sp.]HEX2814170.1 metal/formaldehyde-sensitive transcriptional repressor [Sphingopyxis sp.]